MKVEQNNSEAKKDSDIINMEVFNQLKKLFGDQFEFGVGQFINNALKNIDNIEQALADGDSETLERAAHSLNGSSGQFGALVLSDIAEKIEAFGKQGDFDQAKQSALQIRVAHEQVAELMLAEL